LPEFPEQASYAVALAFQIRYAMQLSAREAMHLIELRSGPQGHPAYRQIAQEMHQAIAREAGHGAIASAMSFVDYSNAPLGRLDAEQRLDLGRGGESSQLPAPRGAGGDDGRKSAERSS
jgi:hypothetical protein